MLVFYSYGFSGDRIYHRIIRRDEEFIHKLKIKMNHLNCAWEDNEIPDPRNTDPFFNYCNSDCEMLEFCKFFDKYRKRTKKEREIYERSQESKVPDLRQGTD